MILIKGHGIREDGVDGAAGKSTVCASVRPPSPSLPPSRSGLPVVQVISKLFPARFVSRDRLYRYLVHKLDPVVSSSNSYSLVWMHTTASYWDNCPSLVWMWRTYERWVGAAAGGDTPTHYPLSPSTP